MLKQSCFCAPPPPSICSSPLSSMAVYASITVQQDSTGLCLTCGNVDLKIVEEASAAELHLKSLHKLLKH